MADEEHLRAETVELDRGLSPDEELGLVAEVLAVPGAVAVGDAR